MLTRLLDAFRPRTDDRSASVAYATADVSSTAPTAHAPSPRDPILPHPSVMLEAWRQEIARAAIALRDHDGAEASHARAHAEALLLTLTLDPDMVVRSPPPAAQEALAVASDPACELPRLVAIIERDPTLTRGLMRHASSAMYAAAGAPASINDATRRLGAKGVQIAVLAGMAEGLLAHGAGPYSALANTTWASMVRVGPIARALSRAVAVPAHEAFLLGLLHDIGALVLLDLLGAAQAARPGAPILPAPFVADALRDLHEPLGGITLLRWGIDPRAAWAVADHHRRVPFPNPDRRGELLYLSTRVDAALVARERPDVAQWFVDGQLTVAPDHVRDAVDRIINTGAAAPH